VLSEIAETASAVSQASVYGFGALLLGAIAAAIGGSTGTRRREEAVDAAGVDRKTARGDGAAVDIGLGVGRELVDQHTRRAAAEPDGETDHDI